jgi:hypothetical protein
VKELRHGRRGQRWSAARALEGSSGPAAACRRARVDVEVLQRDGSRRNRTEGNEAARGGSLAWAATEGPAARQGRGERGSGSRRRSSKGAEEQ